MRQSPLSPTVRGGEGDYRSGAPRGEGCPVAFAGLPGRNNTKMVLFLT